MMILLKLKEKKKFYSIKKLLGNGGFRNVFLGYDNVNKREVVIKKIKKSEAYEKFNREIKEKNARNE